MTAPRLALLLIINPIVFMNVTEKPLSRHNHLVVYPQDEMGEHLKPSARLVVVTTKTK